MSNRPILEKALSLWRQNGAILRTHEAVALGIHQRTLYALRDAGLVETLGRGLFRLAELPPLTELDFVIVTRTILRGVICLVSALAFHELTTQIPHAVSIALRRGDRRPRLEYPPLHVYWFSGATWSEGIETHRIDDTPVRIYNPAKSVADSFKFRQQIGTDVALEALRTYRQSSQFNPSELLYFSRLCRVEHILQPYLEALI